MLSACEVAEDGGRVRELLRHLHQYGCRPLVLVGYRELPGQLRECRIAVRGSLSPAATVEILRAALASAEAAAAGELGGAVPLRPVASGGAPPAAPTS